MGSAFRPRSSTGLSGEPSNVYEMGRYRKRRIPESNRLVLFISDEALADFPLSPHFSLMRISNTSQFETAVKDDACDLVVVDASVNWISPVEAIERFTSEQGCPVILALRDSSLHQSLPLLKEAYAAGISDVIPLPIPREEFIEIVEVLFKLRLAQTHVLP